MCKFYMRYGKCKFDKHCSYLHQTIWESRFELLSSEVHVLKSQNEVLHSELLRLQNEVCLQKKNSMETNSIAMDTVTKTHASPSDYIQIPVNCIRKANGCQNLILSYYSEYTAICDTCKKYLKQKLMSTPHPHYLCPCCHKRSEGPPLSLCSECFEDIQVDGFTESGYGSWHLDRRSGEIVCISLDHYLVRPGP